jgi:UDP-2-acetamido-3-amino-2,3-dideoxy-glucuronate N-acetyltransferase
LNSKLIQLQSFKDDRGVLAVGSTPKEVPFEVRRFFITSATSPSVVRGQHAHKVSHQLLVAVAGSVTATCDDGHTKTEHVLDSSNIGLYMPPFTWGEQTSFSEGAKLLVLASELYDPKDYIENYEEFISLVQG